MEMEMSSDPEEAKAAMRCVGCGGKVGGSVLSKVLKDLDVQPHEDVLLGLDQPDDAAILKTDGQVTLTTDFFAAPFDDPWMVGRLAALNSASDAFAMGAQPTAALANIQIAYGSPQRQQEELFELLSGAMHEFLKMGATIAGGHTIEGPRLTAGFTVAAKQIFEASKKGGLKVGDKLILTKPIGSGVLLAGLMQALCNARDFQKLQTQMVLSNQIALELLANPQVTAVTDVTGFGLAGHLLEMLSASQVCATIGLDNIAVYDGVRELVEERQIESTLAEQNREVDRQISASQQVMQRFEYKTLFDPQTCGGLLFGVSSNAEAVVEQLIQHGCQSASIIGAVTACSTETVQLQVDAKIDF